MAEPGTIITFPLSRKDAQDLLAALTQALAGGGNKPKPQG
ncbi:MAG: hypothetical protein ETSY2_41175 [Candidatus Entotheonella gemina]|uniref:Uncharacterized protein n=1 Tax=Candidatus Entotheonella gemina TaxID=1429439 RepID=W4LN54_9BACT|nr:MAG: hypothetical protein ETSY2_41175 [Candidatus Entotheonella gemina]